MAMTLTQFIVASLLPEVVARPVYLPGGVIRVEATHRRRKVTFRIDPDGALHWIRWEGLVRVSETARAGQAEAAARSIAWLKAAPYGAADLWPAG